MKIEKSFYGVNPLGPLPILRTNSMATVRLLRGFACILWFLFLPMVSAIQPSLVVGESSVLQLSPGVQVLNSPGTKEGTKVYCERVHIHGLSRLKNLGKFANSLKVKVSQASSSIRPPKVEVCFHRNASIGIGMCPVGQWEKVDKGSWGRPMSPFDYKLLDIRMPTAPVETLEVSIEQEFFPYRVIFLFLGIVLLSLASSLSKSLVFYYGSAMAVGVILVILMVLFQGMKLLPTGRKSSLAIFLYSSVVGLGSFLLRYLPGLLRSVLVEMGISEDMYTPLAIFSLAFVVLAGAWLGFWVVRKLVLTEDGSVDISTSLFVAWSIRILAVVLILQSSLDPLLAAEALISGIMVSSVLRRITRLRFLRRMCKKLFKLIKKLWIRSDISDISPFQGSYDEFLSKRPDDTKFLRHRSKEFSLASCNSSMKGFSSKSPRQLLNSDSYPSSFHDTPGRRRFSKDQWETFTKDTTKRAVEELVSSPAFSKWAVANAERISVTPNKQSASSSGRRPKWFQWVFTS